MRKLILSSWMIMVLVIISACSFMSNKELANNRLDEILKYIESKDEESMKGIFSQKALEEDEYFYDKLNYLFGVIEGEITSIDYGDGPIVDRKRHNGSKVVEVKSAFEVETADEKYIVFVIEYTMDTENPENKGVYSLRIINADDMDTQYGSWQSMVIPGIYMPDESIEISE